MNVKYYYLAYTDQTFKFEVINEVDDNNKVAIEVNEARDAWQCGLLLSRICPFMGEELSVPRPEKDDAVWFVAPDGFMVNEFDACPADCSHYKLLERTTGKLPVTYEKEV